MEISKSRESKTKIEVNDQDITLKNLELTYSPIILLLLAISTMKIRMGGRRTPLTTWVVNMTWYKDKLGHKTIAAPKTMRIV